MGCELMRELRKNSLQVERDAFHNTYNCAGYAFGTFDWEGLRVQEGGYIQDVIEHVQESYRFYQYIPCRCAKSKSVDGLPNEFCDYCHWQQVDSEFGEEYWLEWVFDNEEDLFEGFPISHRQFLRAYEMYRKSVREEMIDVVLGVFGNAIRVISTEEEAEDYEAVIFMKMECTRQFRPDMHFVRKDEDGYTHKRGTYPEILRIDEEKVYADTWLGTYNSPLVIFALDEFALLQNLEKVQEDPNIEDVIAEFVIMSFFS